MRVSFRHLPVWSAALASIYLIISISYQPEQKDIDHDLPHSVDTGQQESPQSSIDYAALTKMHWFNREAGSLPPAITGAVTESTQPIKLKGIVQLSSRPPRAIIETADQQQKAYRINETLPGGAILQSIERQKVILMTGNGVEMLTLDKAKPTNAVESSMTDAPMLASPSEESEIIVQPAESLSTY